MLGFHPIQLVLEGSEPTGVVEIEERDDCQSNDPATHGRHHQRILDPGERRLEVVQREAGTGGLLLFWPGDQVDFDHGARA
jgi:hypothetical protein